MSNCECFTCFLPTFDTAGRYHNIHHTEMGTNYCLFMPLYDVLGKTINKSSWDLHREISSSKGWSSSLNTKKFKIGILDRLPKQLWLSYIVGNGSNALTEFKHAFCSDYAITLFKFSNELVRVVFMSVFIVFMCY